MSKHTPGPWCIDDSIFKLGYFLMIRNADGELIAETDKLEDANLIAAAPELLEALELILPTLPGVPVVGSDAEVAVNAVRAALAKARGESVDTG